MLQDTSNYGAYGLQKEGSNPSFCAKQKDEKVTTFPSFLLFYRTFLP